MQNYSVAVLTKKGPKEKEADTLTIVKVSVENETDILKEAFKSKPIFDLLSCGYRYCNHVYDEI